MLAFAEVYPIALPLVLPSVTVFVLTLQEKVPPAGELVVLQDPFVVLEGAVGPRARCCGLQLRVTVGMTVTPESDVLAPGIELHWHSSMVVLAVGSSKGGTVAVTVELPGDRQDTKPVPTDATEEFELLQEKLEAGTG